MERKKDYWLLVRGLVEIGIAFILIYKMSVLDISFSKSLIIFLVILGLIHLGISDLRSYVKI